MKNAFLLLAFIAGLFFTARAQKRVISYPFEFDKAFLNKKNYDSYFLQDAVTQQFMLVLKDNKKAEYALFDDKMKLVAKFSPSNGLQNTVFNFDNEEYLGGTAGNGKFHFVYKVTDKKLIGSNTYYQVETVDPVNKQVTNRQLFEIPRDEELIASFGNFGRYFSITASNRDDELKIYGLNAAGESFTRSVKIAIPSTSKKKKLTDYLEGMKLVTAGEEPGLESATEKVKIFHTPDRLTISVNESDDPTQLITINVKDFSSRQSAIDHTSLTKDEKGKSYVNSFLFDGNIYSLVLNKKNIRIAIYNTAGELLKTHEINGDTDPGIFAEGPLVEQRAGKRAVAKDIGSVKKVIKALDRGSEAIMLSKDKKGRLVLTVGTYDLIKFQTGGNDAMSHSVLSSSPTPGTHNTRVGNMYMSTWRTGRPSYISYSANFYQSTRFKLLLDPATLNLVSGMALASVTDQIKDYLAEISRKAEAMNLFNIGDNMYFGYYSRDEKLYVVDEIFIRK